MQKSYDRVTIAGIAAFAVVSCALIFGGVRALELTRPQTLAIGNSVSLSRTVVVGLDCGADSVRVYGSDDLGAAAKACKSAERHNVPA